MKNLKAVAKNYLLIFALILTTFVGKGQNLVLNENFEH